MAGLGGNPHGKDTIFKLDDLTGTIADVSKLLSSAALNQSSDRPTTKTFGSHARRTKLGLQDGGTIPISGEWRKTALVDVHGKTTRVLIDRYSIAADLRNTVLRRSIDIPAISTFPDGGASFVRRPNIGAQDGSLNLSGHFNAAAGKTDIVFTALKAQTLPSIVSIAAEGFAPGNLVDMGKFQLTNYGINAGTEAPTEITADLASDDQQDLGVSLNDDLTAITFTGTTNGTTVDESASTSFGWAAHLHVKTYSGFTNLIVKIQDSADGAAWADLSGATFATLTGVGEQRLEAATSTAVVRQFVRAVLTTTGAGSFNAAVVLARRGYTYGAPSTHRHLCGLLGRAATSTFEIGFEGSTAGANKKSGECRLMSLQITYPVDSDTTFSAELVIDGAVTDGVWP
jgi:hypothetical protein